MFTRSKPPADNGDSNFEDQGAVMEWRRRRLGAVVVAAAALCGLVILAITAFERLDTLGRRKAIAAEIQGYQAQYSKDRTDRASLEKIIQIANGRYSFGKTYALLTLAEMQVDDPDAMRAYIECLQSNDGFVRDSASQALGMIGTKARPAKLALAEAITKYPDERTALFAVEALEHIGDADPDVLDALNFAHSKNGDSFARAEAGKALKAINKKQGP
jgi:hypothetical protein